jgi:hypothetical protein
MRAPSREGTGNCTFARARTDADKRIKSARNVTSIKRVGENLKYKSVNTLQSTAIKTQPQIQPLTT